MFLIITIEMDILFSLTLGFLLFTFFLWLIIPALYGLPPVTTRRERIRAALQLANLQPGETLYDLGSGHGRVLVIAAKEFDANAVGIEIGPVQCAIARANAMLNGVSSKVRIEAGDFYKSDLNQADVVFAYLTSHQAPRLRVQLEKQLKPGARVVTVSFDFPEWKPIAIDREELIFLYHIPPAQSD